MGCFLTVTEEDYEQIKHMKGVSRAGSQGRSVRVEIGTKNWSRGAKKTLANQVRKVISENKSVRHSTASRRAQATVRRFQESSPNVQSLASFRGLMHHQLGKIAEEVAMRVLEDTQDLKAWELTTGKGPDLQMHGKGGSSVMVEVKSNQSTKSRRSFKGRLKYGHGHRQGSDPWLIANGVDPQQVNVVLGVDIDMPNHTYSIYERSDGSAENWEPIAKDRPLQDRHLG